MGVTRGGRVMQLMRHGQFSRGEPDRINGFSELRRILSNSIAEDVFCRSPLYFAFTGRAEVWTVQHNNVYLILLRHPNISNTMLVFFPFISSSSELTGQIKILKNCSSFISNYEVLLARIPEKIAVSVDCRKAKIQHVDEKILDWAYPSYDLCVESFLNPQGAALSNYRNMIRRFRKQEIQVITAKEIPRCELQMAVKQINDSWILTKQKRGTWLSNQDIDELKAPYRALADASEDETSDIDGIFLKRENAYIAFSFWEKLRYSYTVPCFAAMTSSYEPGLSEFLLRCIAEHVKDRYRYICFGGSETASLDRFKRKFAPVKTHALRTMRLVLQAEATSF
jgi:Phosphatidylglycerol lysyltransferase, C-terminal